MNKFYTLIYSLAVCCIACNTSERNELFIIPKPKESKVLSSYFNLDNFNIYADNNSVLVANLLSLELNKLNYASDSISLFENPILDNSINLLLIQP
ncbi:MAG: hypothetical protein CM15mP107_2370 [Bacteroidota bacterium]|nr:MAG: hypothetical protein CM15mP107_2370 [Bacteroidota bacterium]